MRLAAFLLALSCACAQKQQPPPPPAETEEQCVDRWLKEQKLDEYGGEEGTMYAGGTPLFDERTGKTTPRLEYVYGKQPGAKAACAGAR